MALRNIVTDPAEGLRKICKEVKKMTPHLETLIEDMKETMYAADGVGIAAPQVGVQRRIAVVDVGQGPIVLVNPVIVEQEGEVPGQEGCLSCPDRWGIVNRPHRIKVETMDGVIEAEGYLARAICHETDHLNGILFIDKMERELTDEELRAMAEEDDEDFEDDEFYEDDDEFYEEDENEEE